MGRCRRKHKTVEYLMRSSADVECSGTETFGNSSLCGDPLELSPSQWVCFSYHTAYSTAPRMYWIPSNIIHSYRICRLNWLAPYLRQPWATATMLERPIPTNIIARKVRHLGVATSGWMETTAHAIPTTPILRKLALILLFPDIEYLCELECHHLPCSSRRFVYGDHNNIRSKHLARNCRRSNK